MARADSGEVNGVSNAGIVRDHLYICVAYFRTTNDW